MLLGTLFSIGLSPQDKENHVFKNVAVSSERLLYFAKFPSRISAATLLVTERVSGRNWAYFFVVKSAFLCVSIFEIISMLNFPLLARLTAK